MPMPMRHSRHYSHTQGESENIMPMQAPQFHDPNYFQNTFSFRPGNIPEQLMTEDPAIQKAKMALTFN